MKAFYALTGFGHEAVIIFFVISGFLVGGNSLEKLRKSRITEIEYIVNRVTRIYTVLIPAIVACYILDKVGLAYFNNSHIYTMPSGFHGSLQYIIADRLTLKIVTCNLLMLQEIYSNVIGSNTPLWSLSYEWWYYMIFLCIISISLNRTYSYSLLAKCLCILISMVILPISIMSMFLIWLMGVMLVPVLKYNIRLNPICGAFVFLSCLFVSRLTYNHAELFWIKFLINCTVGIGCFLFYASIQKVEKVATLFPKFNSYMANFSYTLYLVHCPFLVCAVAFTNDIFGVRFYQQPTGLQFCYFLLLIVIIYLYAFLFSLLTEKHTSKIRRLAIQQLRSNKTRLSRRWMTGLED